MRLGERHQVVDRDLLSVDEDHPVVRIGPLAGPDGAPGRGERHWYFGTVQEQFVPGREAVAVEVRPASVVVSLPVVRLSGGIRFGDHQEGELISGSLDLSRFLRTFRCFQGRRCWCHRGRYWSRSLARLARDAPTSDLDRGRSARRRFAPTDRKKADNAHARYCTDGDPDALPRTWLVRKGFDFEPFWVRAICHLATVGAASFAFWLRWSVSSRASNVPQLSRFGSGPASSTFRTQVSAVLWTNGR